MFEHKPSSSSTSSNNTNPSSSSSSSTSQILQQQPQQNYHNHQHHNYHHHHYNHHQNYKFQQQQQSQQQTNFSTTPPEKITMASVPNRNSVDEQIFQQNVDVLGRQSPPVEQPSSAEDFISIANSDSRLLLCRYSSSGSATGGGISGASDGMPIGHESLVGSVGSGSDRLAHYGSTSTTFSTGSFNLTGTNFGGGNCCSLDQSSMASSSGVATMSSTDYLPTTSDFVSSLSRSSADDSTPTMSTLTGEGGTAVALRRELEPLLSGAASTLSTSTTTGIMSNSCSAVATTLSNLSLNSPVCPSTSCICPSVLNTKTASTTTTATTTSASIEDSSVADDFMPCSPLLASYEQAQSTPSLHWSGAIVDARENNNNNGSRQTSTANNKWEKSATPSEQQKNQSKQTGTKTATSADKLTGSCGGKRRATAMHQKMEEATASQNCGSSDGADRGREQQCCCHRVGSSAKQNCRTTVTTTKGADPITSMASTTTSMAPPINLPPSTSSSTAVLLPVQPQQSSSQNISPTSSSAAFHQTHHHSLLGSSPLPSMFNCAATSVCSQIICTPLRTIVSQNRRRYQMDGFNLDLTYITDRIIAMGYPADTKEALYRNSMSHIVKFLEHYHPGHYKVFNLRGQYVYDPANFHNRVVTFEMADHHPPRLELMAPFCREVHDYLDEDPQNVVAVHCKAGKGRTGVMICAYLCYIAFYRTPRQNMDYYSIIRTHNNKGVTIPSQRRYVYYFSHLRARQLNYMPLRCELVGVYLEKPPKLNGPFSKGALKVRVACGDVDVFLGDDLWLNGERFEEEEELHKRYPLMSGGEDQYDPLNPDNLSKSCVSRRCYGWTVPSNKRVFLEGDIRLDIFQKSRLKLFNVKQERKKIGHIWFNTMFTCPGFCGGPYVHGDEAYPYPESMIVQRRFKKKQNCGNADVAMDTEGNEQQSLAQQMQQQQPHYYHHPFSHSSPSFAAHHPASAPAIVAAATAISDNCSSTTATTTDCSSADECAINPGQKRLHKHSLRFGGIKLTNGNGSDNAVSASETTKKRSARSPCRRLFESEQKGWQSQDSGGTVENKSAQVNQKPCRSSLDTAECDYEEEIVVEKAPGLERHCPPESLRSIYPNEKMAPRYGIEEMIREAFQKNLINDIYNARRMSQPRDGPLITKAPEGRPNANGPFCLIRRPDEHVHVFGVQEIDRAYKNKDIDLGFKVYIITRCIDESIPSDLRLAEQFVRITHQKQTQKDNQKLEKMQMRQRKMIIAQHQQMMNTHQMQTTSASAIQQQKSSNASTSTEDGFSVSASSCIVPMPTSSAYESSSVPTFGIGDIEPVTEDCPTPISPDQFEPAKKQPTDDPRLSDPYLQKYFFRQRVTSHSRHPSVHHHCSLRKPDPNVCAKFGCNGIDSTPTAIIHQHSQSSQASFSSSYQKTTVTTVPKVQSHLTVPHQNRYCVNNLIRNSGDEGDNEEFEEGEADIEEEDACSFDDFDFFHPRQHTSSTVRAVSFSNYSRSNKNNNGTKQNSGTTVQPMIYTTAPSTSSSFSTSGDGLKIITDETTENLTNELPSSVHCQNENMPMIDHDGVEGVKSVSTTHGEQHFTALPPATICGAKDSISSAPVSLLSEPMEPEVYHPSDCSLAPSTSSSCSSSD